MEKDQGSWLYHLQPDGQFLNTNNISSSVFGSQRPNGLPANGFLPGYPYSGIPQSKVGQLTEPFGWSYCLPRFRQAFTSMQNKSSVQREENLKESVQPNNPASLQQKRFLVFDQSGDQTTLMFSSGIGNHVPGLASMAHKFDKVCAPLRMNVGNRVNLGHLTEEYNEYHNDDTESEMREDTEELNALLYSDDDSDCDYEEEEEMSTGHSPNIESGEDEVASSVGQSVEEGEEEVFDDVQSVMDTASSGKRKRCFEDEQDAESYCTGGKKKKKKKKQQPQTGLECEEGRSKKEKIRETVGILQKIIPGSRGKDAIVVLDEAIAYLKALQCKAEAVGFQIS